jgi:hypothetical protein
LATAERHRQRLVAERDLADGSALDRAEEIRERHVGRGAEDAAGQQQGGRGDDHNRARGKHPSSPAQQLTQRPEYSSHDLPG